MHPVILEEMCSVRRTISSTVEGIPENARIKAIEKPQRNTY